MSEKTLYIISGCNGAGKTTASYTSRYKLIKEKALRNETLVEGDYKGGTRTVSARKLLKEIYNEEISINN